MAAKLAVACLSILAMTGCQAKYLGEDTKLYTDKQILHLIENPKYWDGKVFWTIVYPYDNGFSQSYRICFEPCDADSQQSPFVIYTADKRFVGANGQKPEVVKVRFDGRCSFGKDICPDLLSFRFYEIQ